MRYIFRILILGSPELAFPYITAAFQDKGEDKESYIEWFKEITVLQDKCDLEINLITDMTANFDEIIPSVDGIIYFLNPLEKSELDLFEITHEIISKVRHEIPTILFYYPEDDILPISSLDLLKSTWIQYPDLEGFVNLHPYNFHQVLQCICTAMISGDTPLNLENAWFRFPIYISLINHYYENRKYYEAAKAAKKAALIAQLFERDDYYIISEQAAYLYSKLNLYLEASKILEDVDKIASNNFKRLYVESMIREGNKLFNKKQYEMAAKQYENAAQWASIELKDKNLIVNSFKYAINSWISSLKFDKAFNILERLPHEEINSALIEISNKIVGAADYLISEDKLKKARDQLYIAINTFQGRGLFEPMKEFINKQLNVLTKIVKRELNSENKDIYYLREIYDEIENLWETFDVEKRDLDYLLEDIIRLFLEKFDFGEATELMNKLNSLKLKKELTEYSSEMEEKYKTVVKQAKYRTISKGVEFIKEFMKAENQLIREMNKAKIETAKKYIHDDGDYLKASEVLMNQVNYLLQMNKEKIADQIIEINLNHLINGKQFREFFNVYTKLSNRKIKKRYLSRIYQTYLQKLKEFKQETDQFLKIKWVFENSIDIFRDQMLYEESKSMGEEYLDKIHKEALEISNRETNKEGIEKTVNLIKKAKFISDSYLEHETISFDDVHKNLVELYISLGDISTAQAYNDRIEDKKLKKEVHEKIESYEKQRSEEISERIQKSINKERLKEKLSIIKKQARDALQDKENGLRQRKGLKRVYFKEALEYLENKEYEEALDVYKTTIKKLNDVKKYDLAGISLAVISLILLKKDQLTSTKEFYKDQAQKNNLFSKTFPIKLVEYVSALNEIQESNELDKALKYYENLPLFEEELNLLYDLLGGKPEKKKEKPESKKPASRDFEELKKQLTTIAAEIINQQSDISKRKLMKRQYFNSLLQLIKENKLMEAADSYLKTVDILLEKKMLKQAAICLILGTTLKYFEENYETALSDYTNILKFDKEEMKKLPEIRFMEKFLKALEAENKASINLGLNLIIENLILFDEEKELLDSLIDKKGEGEELIEAKPQSEEELRKIEELDQLFSKIKHKFRDVKGDTDIFRRRKALKRRFYNDILTFIKDANFEEAATKYKDLAYTFAKRKDFQSSALVLFLYGLSSLNTHTSTNTIEKTINEYLDSLGLSKKLVKETFFILLIKFILKVLKYDQYKTYEKDLVSMIKDLPLFEKEKKMLDTIIQL